MLPECRKEADIFSIPKFDVESSDMDSFMDELRSFHGEFRDCFQRSETRELPFLVVFSVYTNCSKADSYFWPKNREIW